MVILVVAVILIILAPIIARLIYLAVSRRREYLADATGATYTRYPEALASALEKIGGSTEKLRVANPATAGMYFVNPLRSEKFRMSSLGSTHPPTEERVRILRSMGVGPGFASYDQAFRRVTGRPVGVLPASALTEGGAAGKEIVPGRPPGSPLGTLPMGGTTASTPGAGVLAGAAVLAHVDRVRETTDALWKTDRYRFIECPCETRLKIPPELADREITCPHCGRTHPAGGTAGELPATSF